MSLITDHCLPWLRSNCHRIAGVCAGLAEQFGISVTALRLAAVLLTLLGAGWGLVVYVVLWVIMPYRDRTRDRDQPSPMRNDAGY